MSVVVTPMSKQAGCLALVGVEFGICGDGSLFLEGPYGFFKQCSRNGIVDGIN